MADISKIRFKGVEYNIKPLMDEEPTENSINAVQSGGVKSALDGLQAEIPDIDDTLTKAGQAADSKAVGDEIEGVKDNLNGINETLGYVPVSTRIINNTRTYIGVEDSKLEFSAQAGEKIKVKFSGTAYTNASTCRLYVYYVGESQPANLGVVVVGEETEVVLSKAITHIATYSSNLVEGTIVISAQSGEIAGIIGDVDALKNDAITKNEYLLTMPVANDFYLSGGRCICKYGQLKKGGTLKVYSIPDGCSFGVQEHSGPAYSNETRVSDTGWLTTAGITININKDYYYYVVIKNTDGTNIENISVTDDFELLHTFTTKAQAKENADNITQIADSMHKYMPMLSETVKTIAHRGDQTDAPKNTAPAYIVARKNGNTIAENDVTISSDGVFVCWHDVTFAQCGNLLDINGYLMYTDGNEFYYYDSANDILYTHEEDTYVASSVALSSLTRCAGVNYSPESLPFSVLKRIDVGVYKGSKFRGTQILTFEEWVMLCKQLGMEIYVDRKIDPTTAQLQTLANIVKKCGMLHKTSWLNIYPNMIPTLRAIDPTARIGLLTHPSASGIETYSEYNTGRGVFFNGSAKSGMTAETIQLGLNAGFEVEVYYVDYSGSDTTENIYNIIRTAVSYGVTGMTLDHYRVDEAFQYLLEQY